MSSLILKCIQQENLKNFVFLAGLVLCVINGLRPENLSKKIKVLSYAQSMPISALNGTLWATNANIFYNNSNFYDLQHF